MPAPLNAQDILSTLKDLNVLLHLRLNLHEDLPPYFNTFTIQSGRATFVVPDEFEVDLSIADEDFTTQFYFIDIRFLFSPRSEIPTGVLRGQVEARANDVLARDGLVGCYEFLHEFVLTLKINTLRRQALEMSRMTWSGCLQIEQVHRVLVVHYWTDRPYPKSWIEIGVTKRKRHESMSPWIKQEPSSLHVRWMREGKEVTGADIHHHDSVLSMDAILRAVIRLHVDYNLELVHHKLVGVNVSLQNAASERLPALLTPGELSLRIGDQYSSKLLMNLITGEYCIQPASTQGSYCSEQVNTLHNAAQEAHTAIQLYQASMHQATSRTAAISAGWNLANIRNLEPGSVQKAFGKETLRASFFTKAYWGTEWAVAQSFTATTASWWVVKFTSDWTVKRIVLRDRLPISDFEGSVLSLLEAYCTAFISVNCLSKSLKGDKIPHSVSLRRGHQPSLNIDMAKLMGKAIAGAATTTTSKTSNILVAEFRGFHGQADTTTPPNPSRAAICVVKGFLAGGSRLESLLSSVTDTDITLNPQGGFAILFRTSLGSPDLLERLKARLVSLHTLRDVVQLVDKRQFDILEVAANSISFAYGKSEGGGAYSVACTFATNATTRIVFSPPHQNPHNRLLRMFTQLMSPLSATTSTASPFATFLKALALTLPVLRALSFMEHDESSGSNVVVQARTFLDYHVLYPQHRYAFVVVLLVRRGQPMWNIEQAGRRRGETFTKIEEEKASNTHAKEELQSAVKKLFSTFQGGVALRRGMAVTPENIELALKELDATIRKVPPSEREQSTEATGIEAGSLEDLSSSQNPVDNTTAAQKGPSERPAPKQDTTQPNGVHASHAIVPTPSQQSNISSGRTSAHEVVEID